ncbi:MAG: hypothetical protein ABIG96_00420 [Candidatus Micrarchaeota archaeon]
MENPKGVENVNPHHQEAVVGMHRSDGAGQKQDVSLPMKTFGYVEVDPKVRANMRAQNRWDYMNEYIAYWVDNKRFWIFAILFVSAGILMLSIFAPVGLLLIMLGAKYRNVAWMDKFVYAKFGKYRSLVLVD